jgi:hypothetical protein
MTHSLGSLAFVAAMVIVALNAAVVSFYLYRWTREDQRERND